MERIQKSRYIQNSNMSIIFDVDNLHSIVVFFVNSIERFMNTCKHNLSMRIKLKRSNFIFTSLTLHTSNISNFMEPRKWNEHEKTEKPRESWLFIYTVSTLKVLIFDIQSVDETTHRSHQCKQEKPEPQIWFAEGWWTNDSCRLQFQQARCSLVRRTCCWSRIVALELRDIQSQSVSIDRRLEDCRLHEQRMRSSSIAVM